MWLFIRRAWHVLRNSATVATAATVAVSAISTGAILGVAGGGLKKVDGAAAPGPATSGALRGALWSPPIAVSVAASQAVAAAQTEGASSVLGAVKGTSTEGASPNLVQVAALIDPGATVRAAPRGTVAQVLAARVGQDKKKSESVGSDTPRGSDKKAKDSGKKAKSKKAEKQSKHSDPKSKKSSGDWERKSKKDAD